MYSDYTLYNRRDDICLWNETGYTFLKRQPAPPNSGNAKIRSKQRMNKNLMTGIWRFLADAMTAIAMLLIVAGLFGNWHPALDALSHLRHFLVIAVLFGALTCAAFGSRRLAILSTVALGAALAISFPHLPFVDPSAKTAGGLRVIQFNVKIDNAQQERAANWMIAQKPDVVTLQEFDPVNHTGFQILAKELPFEVTCKARGFGYVVIRSRHQIEAQHCSEGEGFAWVRVNVQGQLVTFATVHLAWPWPFKQAEQLKNLKPAFAVLPTPVVLTGDFNATPWSATVSQIETMTSTKAVGGFRISLWLDVFHTGKPWPVLPIDHVLLPPNARLKSIESGPFLGSDHLPVVADFALN